MKLFFIPFAFCLWAEAVFAQQSDTVYLREISVFGLPVTEYATGSKVETLRITDPLSTLAGGLSGETSIYLKNYGNQQLSSIALRGTTASQTAVVWNGININSPTLGQTDFSLIPLFLFDEVSLHYGTATSFYGSDAIGGSVVVGHSTPEFKKTFSGTLHQQVGSFGKSVSGVKFSYGNERWQFRTKAYRAFIQNDFSYTSPAVGRRKKQHHASVINYSFDQQVHYKISPDKILWGEIMYTDNDREVQPTVTSNDANETLSNKNLRAAINYRHDSRWGVIHATSAWQFSDQDFTNDLTSTVQSTQFTAQINIDRPVTTRSNLRYGLSYNYYTATAENFHDVGEGRYDVFASWRYAVLAHWIVNLNVRQSIYDQRYAPFSPTLGSEIFLIKEINQKISFRSQAARGYRVPTLDDRYWTPGGNPATKPEDALHVEAGIVWQRKISETSFEANVTYHQSWVDKMIVWRPDDDGIWTPVNLQKVYIKGAEFSSHIENSAHRIRMKAGVSYSYTQSLNKVGIPAGDPAFVDKQLPYVPLHDARAFVVLSENSGWQLSLNHSYTGIRYSDLDNVVTQSLKGFQLTDASLSKKQVFKKWSAEAMIGVRNALDIYYENLINRAMPGRNYLISLVIHF